MAPDNDNKKERDLPSLTPAGLVPISLIYWQGERMTFPSTLKSSAVPAAMEDEDTACPHAVSYTREVGGVSSCDALSTPIT